MPARFLLTALLLVTPCLAAGDDWPQWRGPTLNGASPSGNLPTTWSTTENIAWRTKLPAWAGSTPIVHGNRIFLTSPSAEDGASGEVTRKWRGGRSTPGGPDLLLISLDRASGKILWKKTITSGNTLFGKHNMASPSPVTDGRHVWALTGTGVIAAFDYEGNEVWNHDLQEDYGKFGQGWGYAASPLYHDGLVIVAVLHGARGEGGSYLVAFDGATGKVAWKVDRRTDAERECPDAYTTPIIVAHGGREDLVISGADYVTGHDPKTGKERWRAGGLNPEKRGNYRICGTPTFVDGLIYCTSRQRPILALKAGGEGDVTTSHLAWKFDGKKGPDVPSVVSDGKYMYMADDRGFASCLDAKTGEVVWGPERTTQGTYSSSLILGDGKWYITNENGVTTVLATGPEFKILSVNDLEDAYTISTPAIAGDQILVRTSEYLYCIGEGS